jgi:hypothetical protein
MTNATLLKRALCASTAAWDYKTTREIAKCSLPTIRRTLLALEAEGFQDDKGRSLGHLDANQDGKRHAAGVANFVWFFQ